MNAVMLKMLEEDREETRQEIAKHLLADHIDVDKIVEYTGLPRDEVLKLTP